MITDDIYLDFHAGDGGDGKVSLEEKNSYLEEGPDGVMVAMVETFMSIQ